jgi:hypothetical protein
MQALGGEHAPAKLGEDRIEGGDASALTQSAKASVRRVGHQISEGSISSFPASRCLTRLEQ